MPASTRDPVIPPEGVAPVTDPGAADTTSDQLSPTTLVLNYLRTRGYQPSSENVRRALEADARDPGVIPGLRTDRPATEAEDQAAMRAAGVGGGRRTPYVPSGTGSPSDTTPITDTSSGSGSQTTSAPPAGGGGPSTDALGWMVAAGVPLTAALGYGAYRARAPGPGTPMPGASAGPMPDVAPPAPGTAPPLATPAPASPMEAALAKAVPTGASEPLPIPGGSVPPAPQFANLPPQGPVEAVAPKVPFTPTPDNAPRTPPTQQEIDELIRTSPTLRGTPPARNLRIPTPPRPFVPRPPLVRVP